MLVLGLALKFLETNCAAALHFGSLCCRARGMSLIVFFAVTHEYGVCVKDFPETDYMASLHCGSLCGRGYLRRDQHVRRLFKVRPVPVLMLMLALAHFFLPVSVLMLMRVPVPFCHRICGFGAAYILALWSFADANASANALLPSCPWF